MITMQTNSLIYDFKWVLKILDSSESKEHMDTTLRCFNLWENKYVVDSLPSNEKMLVRELRSNFWCKFKNKISDFGTFNF